MDVVFVRNLARDPHSRITRNNRPGSRLGFILCGGQRIRRKGVRRTSLSSSQVLENAALLERGIADACIEVTRQNGEVITLEVFRGMVSGKAPKAEATPKPVAKPAKEPEEESAPAAWTKRDLEQLNRSDLAALASERGIETKKVSKSKLVSLLLKGQEE